MRFQIQVVEIDAAGRLVAYLLRLAHEAEHVAEHGTLVF